MDCGFALRQGTWKLLRGSGGEPSGWLPPVNLSSLGNSALSSPLLATRMTVTGSAGQCNVEQGVAFPSNDIDNVAAANFGDCCDACLKDTRCVGWTYRPGSSAPCFIKFKLDPTPSVCSDCVSGTPGNLPPPPELKNASMLFDLANDPNEHNNVGSVCVCMKWIELKRATFQKTPTRETQNTDYLIPCVFSFSPQ